MRFPKKDIQKEPLIVVADIEPHQVIVIWNPVREFALCYYNGSTESNQEYAESKFSELLGMGELDEMPVGNGSKIVWPRKDLKVTE